MELNISIEDTDINDGIHREIEALLSDLGVKFTIRHYV